MTEQPSHVRLDSASVKILAHPCDRVWSGPCAMVGRHGHRPGGRPGDQLGATSYHLRKRRGSDWSSTPVRAMASAGSGRPQPASPSSTPATSRATTTQRPRSAGWSATGCNTSTDKFARWLDLRPAWPRAWGDAAGMGTPWSSSPRTLSAMTAGIDEGDRSPAAGSARTTLRPSASRLSVAHYPVDMDRCRAGDHGPTRERAYRVFLLLNLTPCWFAVGFVVGIFILLQTNRGLSIAQAMTAAAVSGFVCFALELPTSGFADAFGRRAVCVAAAGINVVTGLAYLFAQSFWQFVGAAALMGAFRALDSGPLRRGSSTPCTKARRAPMSTRNCPGRAPCRRRDGCRRALLSGAPSGGTRSRPSRRSTSRSPSSRRSTSSTLIATLTLLREAPRPVSSATGNDEPWPRSWRRRRSSGAGCCCWPAIACSWA